MFEEAAKKIFLYQYNNNNVYKQWCDILKIDVDAISVTERIPYLPVSFFKTHKVLCGNEQYETFFESSGTTLSFKSKHYLKHLNIYMQSFTKSFELFYGDIKNWCIIGLLPSYLQQQNSSLVTMVDILIKQSNHKQSGFYLHDYNKLFNVLRLLEQEQQKTLLIGVTYALLDFAEHFPIQLSSTTIMETGGMKGRRKELTRSEVHTILKQQLNVNSIHSEYGMTELLSQAYSKNGGRFYCSPWMKVFIRDEADPFNINKTGKGVLNIIDLANMYSCAFIATDDAGEVFDDGSFTVQGRMDNSDIRGCSLMAI